MKPVGRILATAVCAVAAMVTLGACQNDDTPIPVGSPTPTATGSVAASGPESGKVPPQAPADVHASTTADGLYIEVSAPESTTVHPGTPVRFDVVVQNSTSGDFTGVGVVVSLGHCGCNPGPMKTMPAGSMQLEAADGSWQPAPYVTQGGGTDFLGRTLVPAFSLSAGQSVTYHLKLEVDPAPNLVAGSTRFEATRTDPSAHAPTPVSSTPTASIELNIRP
ncbi:hypothetical protein [Nocardia stercoris]|nr:hypothetical protein [Nocardia stercoris]